MKAQAQQDAEAALAEPLDVYRAFFLDGQPFIGGDAPVDRRHPPGATLEFLRAIDYDFPDWATEYMARMEAALGDAYSRAGRRRARLHRVRQVADRLRARPGSGPAAPAGPFPVCVPRRAPRR